MLLRQAFCQEPSMKQCDNYPLTHRHISLFRRKHDFLKLGDNPDLCSVYITLLVGFEGAHNGESNFCSLREENSVRKSSLSLVSFCGIHKMLVVLWFSRKMIHDGTHSSKRPSVLSNSKILSKSSKEE